MKKQKLKLGTDSSVKSYKCGLKAGDRVRLKKDIAIRRSGKLTGKILKKGGVWCVIAGSSSKPVVLWLREPDESLHTWDDTEAIFDYFDVLPRRRPSQPTPLKRRG